MSPFVRIPLPGRRIELVRMANEAKTLQQHVSAQEYLRGWDDAYTALVGRDALFFQICDCDEEFGGERPVCCGVWLDWEPEVTP